MKFKTVILFLFLILFVSGCFYPNERRIQNQMPYPDQIDMVQNSVRQYQKDTGILPIQTKAADTPIYSKYVIDFKKLFPKYLSRYPANSYEEGGVFRYVLVDVEQEPKVKLIDLRVTDRVGDLQLRVNEYLNRHTYLPVGQMLEGGYFILDYEKLGLKNPPQVKSPYSESFLPFVVNQQGQIGIDYRMDLYQRLQSRNTEDLKKGEDIRFILVEDSYFVPVHSFPYTIENGEPTFLKK